MKLNGPEVIYWDTSAIISTLLQDDHSEQATHYAGLNAIHLISSLAIAETFAVLNRLKRELLLDDELSTSVLKALETGPWRNVKIGPSTAHIKKLASKWPLRGADLWHLATAKTLQKRTP